MELYLIYRVLAFRMDTKISLQTYGSSQANQTQETNIYALYTQKELAGNFIRLGFSPDSDKEMLKPMDLVQALLLEPCGEPQMHY